MKRCADYPFCDWCGPGDLEETLPPRPVEVWTVHAYTGDGDWVGGLCRVFATREAAEAWVVRNAGDYEEAGARLEIEPAEVGRDE